MKMSTSMILILIVIGIITGVMAGMLGIGGAIIMIPSLVFGNQSAVCSGNKSCCDVTACRNYSCL